MWLSPPLYCGLRPNIVWAASGREVCPTANYGKLFELRVADEMLRYYAIFVSFILVGCAVYVWQEVETGCTSHFPPDWATWDKLVFDLIILFPMVFMIAQKEKSLHLFLAFVY